MFEMNRLFQHHHIQVCLQNYLWLLYRENPLLQHNENHDKQMKVANFQHPFLLKYTHQ